MENLNITKGQWYLQEFTDAYTNIVRCKNETHDTLFIAYTPQTTNPEARANAELIAEAGTVANETGLTPRELLNQRNELLEVLKYAKKRLDFAHLYTEGKIDMYDIKRIETAIANTNK